MTDQKTGVRHLAIDSSGRTVLSDDDLDLLDTCAEGEELAGGGTNSGSCQAINGECSNSYCGTTSNLLCTNPQGCDSTSNNVCSNGGGGRNPNEN